MGIFTELKKACRKRENYRDQVRILVRESQDKDREIARLRRKLANARDFINDALA